MALNEKIFEQRRKAGLSQEELAGELGVSRQAVGKWENGTATPDINNIIALAEKFGISVGELLETESGTEESGAGKTMPREEITALLMENDSKNFQRFRENREQEEKAREELSEENRRHRKLTFIMFGALAAAVLVLAVIGGTRIGKLKDELSSLKNDTNRNMNNLILSVNGMENEIKGLLEKQASLYSNFDFSVTGYDSENGDVTARIAVTPKSITEKTEITIVLKNTETDELSRHKALREGTDFVSEITAPEGTYLISTILFDGTSEMSEELTRCGFSPIGLAASFSVENLFPENETLLIGENFPKRFLIIKCSPGKEISARKISSVELKVYKNDEFLRTVTLDTSAEDSWVEEAEFPEGYAPSASVNIKDGNTVAAEPGSFKKPSDGYLFAKEYSLGEIILDSGDCLRVDLVITDELGLKYKTESLEEWYMGSIGGSVGGVTSSGDVSLYYELYN